MSWIRRKLRGAVLVATLVTLRLWLRLFGLGRTRKRLGRLVPPAGETDGRITLDDARLLARRVRHAARWARANCLPRSLLLHALLAHRGAPVSLRIGIDRRRRERLAHAWVEWERTAVGDDPDVRDHYAVLRGGDQEELDVAWVGATTRRRRRRARPDRPRVRGATARRIG